MAFEKVSQALNGISESITKAAATPKEIKIAHEIALAEYIRLTSKDIYHAYWHCRDFEIAHMWQRFVFLAIFLAICFLAYGYLASDMLAVLHTSIRDVTEKSMNIYWFFANGAAIFISYIGATLSVLWIMMVKGSKAWFEIYETAIAAYEKNSKYINKTDEDPQIGTFQFQNSGFFREELRKKNFNCSISNAQGGAYSSSKINWAIGRVALAIWELVTFLHILLSYHAGACWLLPALISAIFYMLLFSKLTSSLKSTSLSDIISQNEK